MNQFLEKWDRYEGLINMTYKTIPYVCPELKISNKTSIVGASGSLKNSNLGDIIDMYDDVIRFNRSPTNGFERDVGSKTTLRVVNDNVLANKDISKYGYTNSPPNFVKDLRHSRLLYIGSDYGPWHKRKVHTHNSNKVLLYDYTSISELKAFLNCSFPQYLLTGSIIVGLCVLAGIKPTLFGFDIEPMSRTHYYEDRPKEWNDVHHNPSEEQKMLKRLRDANQIEIY